MPSLKGSVALRHSLESGRSLDEEGSPDWMNIRRDSTVVPALKQVFRELLENRRDEQQAGPSEVFTALYIDQIWDLNMRSESFKAKFTIFCRWRCPAEHAEDHLAQGADLLDVAWAPAWEPVFRVRDSLTSTMSLNFCVGCKDREPT